MFYSFLTAAFLSIIFSQIAGLNSTKPEPAVLTAPPQEKAPQAVPVISKYSASKNSKVFHRADCSSAKRISAKNFVNYSSRAEAIESGRRPCKICKP